MKKTLFAHHYLLSGDDQSTCSTCHLWTSTYSPSYIIGLYWSTRCPTKTLLVTCLRDLFETVDNRVVIDFIKHVRFYSLLYIIVSLYIFRSF